MLLEFKTIKFPNQFDHILNLAPNNCKQTVNGLWYKNS